MTSACLLYFVEDVLNCSEKIIPHCRRFIYSICIVRDIYVTKMSFTYQVLKLFENLESFIIALCFTSLF